MNKTQFLGLVATLEKTKNNFPVIYFSAKSLSGTVAKMNRVTTRQIERLISLRALSSLTKRNDFNGPLNTWAQKLKQIDFY